VADEVRRAFREERVHAVGVEEFLPVVEAARVASVAPDTIRVWIRQGRLSSHWAGRERRVLRSEFTRCLATSPGPLRVEPSPEEEARRFLARRAGHAGSASKRSP
jgi:excisionase family DNA binding protein